MAEETNPLIDYENRLGGEAVLAVPTPDHYLPLLYVIGRIRPLALEERLGDRRGFPSTNTHGPARLHKEDCSDLKRQSRRKHPPSLAQVLRQTPRGRPRRSAPSRSSRRITRGATPRVRPLHRANPGIRARPARWEGPRSAQR
jgi:hypothetical protein